jgi:hypothetical protein
MKPKKIPVIVCIDIEPDGLVTDRTVQPSWAGYEEACDFFTRIRTEIAAATGSPVHFSWFYRMDPQIADLCGSGAWPATAYPGYAAGFEKNGDEIGLHTHLYRFEPAVGTWVIDNGDPAWVRHCIDSSCSCFEKAFGRPAACHRFGDRFFDSTALAALEQSGCRYDLTMEPGFAEAPGSGIAQLTTGELPDMLDVPIQPYRPSSDNFKRPGVPGQDGLLMIPLSTGRARGRVKLANLFRPSQLYPLHLGLDCRLFGLIATRLIKKLSKPYIGIVLKTDMLLDSQLANNMRSNLEFFMRHRSSGKFAFTTPAEAMGILGYEL